MAKYSEKNKNTGKIYKIAEDFKENCLLKDGSLLSDSVSVWHLDFLKKFHEYFVKNSDDGDRKFIDKLKDQIGDKEKEVILLAAEILIVYFLFPSNIGRETKKKNVNTVLGWNKNGDDLPKYPSVLDAFTCGLGNGGLGYNTRRPSEIAILINFAIAWKGLSNNEKKERVKDPWSFQKFVDTIEDADSNQIRHMLLHLLFPDYFERIASSNHKRRIIEAFGGVLNTEAAREENIDKKILAIRDETKKLLDIEDLDFYKSPLVEAWYDDSESISENAPLKIIQYKKQIILYGPPGTGKTYRAKKLAEQIIRSVALKRWGPAEYFKSQSNIKSAICANVHRLQLHPAYSYEDFIRALHISKEGGTEYRPGFLLKLIESIKEQRREKSEKHLPHVLILDEINRTDLSRMLGECFSLLEDRNQTIELPAHHSDGVAMKLCIPDDLFVIGTMNLIDQSVEQIDFALRRRFLWLSCPFDAEALINAAEFNWKEQSLDLDWGRVEPDFRKLADAAAELNKQICKSRLLGPQYEIGHTYFLDAVVFLRDFLGPQPTRKQIYLWRRNGEACEPVQQVWDLSLKPLLEQYLAGLNVEERKNELDRLSKVFLKPAVPE